MESWLIEHEKILRLSAFIAVLSVMAIWEILAPRKRLSQPKGFRWINNISLVFLNSMMVRVLFPAAAVGFAVMAQQQGWGIFNILFNQLSAPSLGLIEGYAWSVSAVYWSVVMVCVVLQDGIIYWQHRLFHQIPWLWKLHQVHHADQDIDVTTGARFHTFEILLSMCIKWLAIVLLGAPVVSVIIFELLLNVMAMFNHSNVRLPKQWDHWLRKVVVTPDMHRVHHSVYPQEYNRNYGFNLSWWDRLFGSYQAQPKDGHESMRIGLPHVRDPKASQRLDRILMMPFHRRDTQTPSD